MNEKVYRSAVEIATEINNKDDDLAWAHSLAIAIELKRMGWTVITANPKIDQQTATILPGSTYLMERD